MAEAMNPYQSPRTAVADLHDDDARGPVPLLSFKGRLGRLRTLNYAMAFYLLSYLFMGAVTAGAVAGLGDSAGAMILIGLAVFAGIIVMFVGMVSLWVRRLHDLDQSGLWSLMMLVPLVNLVLGIYLTFWPGTPGSNQYGPRPVPNTGWTWAALVLVLVVPTVGILAAVSIPAYQDYVQRAAEIQQAQEAGGEESE